MYDVIVIGAGPAGLSAAIYLRRANKSVLVLEGKMIGGQIINTNKIDNYPACYNISGYDFANNLSNQAKDLGTVIKFEEVTSIINGKIKTVITKKGEAMNFIIGSDETDGIDCILFPKVFNLYPNLKSIISILSLIK